MKISSDLNLNQLQLKNTNLSKSENEFKNLLEQEVNTKNEQKDEQLKAVSKEFESIFLSMMFKQMRDATLQSDLLDGGLNQEMFEDMYYDEIAKEATGKEQLGIAEAVYRQLSNNS
ncbi:rod-binding protein [Natroniella sulfidigena]|uniref:rod-binding protein n=1 Tax=Natroniella sulfidigena TaxID=723921 RepID=UPI00200A86C0|nr:rod-binding protein [Natroniella sulfidigena]MCK8816379.1 rod-binding protein [Natroniella sulfidigena]